MKIRYFVFIIGILLVGCSAPAAIPTQVPQIETPTLIPPTASPTAAPIKSTAPLAGVDGVETSGGFLWAWGENEIWRYTGGEWSPYYSDPTGYPSDVAYAFDTLWIANSELQYLAGDEWQELAGQYPNVYMIKADSRTGLLWLSTYAGENLYRWNGEEMTDAGQPPSTSNFLGEIAVTGDGTVWAGGMNWFFPARGGLARYDDAKGSWEMVRPWRADEDVPAQQLASTPNGGLWAVLADWSEDWRELQETGEPFIEWSLAHRDGASGEWTIFEEGLPGGYPGEIAANDEAVWLAQGWFRPVETEFDGLVRFDGETWSHYLPGNIVEYIGIAPDGTIWYTTEGDDRLHQLQ